MPTPLSHACDSHGNLNFDTWKRDVHSQGLLGTHAHGVNVKTPDHNDEGCMDYPHHGPIAFLVQDLRKCGCVLADDLSIYHGDQFCFNLWDIPWQHLKTAVFDLAIKARDRAINGQRTFLGDFVELDHQVCAAVCAKLGVKERRIYIYICTSPLVASGGRIRLPVLETLEGSAHIVVLKMLTLHIFCGSVLLSTNIVLIMT